MRTSNDKMRGGPVGLEDTTGRGSERMETVSAAIARLRAAGYTDDLVAHAHGLRSSTTGKVHSPETLRVDEVVRFEGESDPGDESVVFALAPAREGPRGIYVAAYGPAMGPLDAEVVPKLGTGWPRQQGTPIGTANTHSSNVPGAGE